MRMMHLERPHVRPSPSQPRERGGWSGYLLPSEESSWRGLTLRGGFLRPAGAMLAMLLLRFAS